MSSFKTIKESVTAQIIEKKSKFIANIFYIESVEEAEEQLNNIKKEHYNAKHNCFAFIVIGKNGEKVKRFSDDGEPSGTAGKPILEILEKQNLCNILVVVTRYFGGILLGTGGLLRAYSGATLEALSNAEFINKDLGFVAEIQTDYKNLDEIKYSLEKEKVKIININYGENVELFVEISENIKDKIYEKNKEKIIKIQLMSKKYIDV